LIPRDDWLRGSTKVRIDAYSEFMPAPRVGWKPYGPVRVSPYLFAPDDPFGWMVHEFDESLELQPGLLQIAKDLVTFRPFGRLPAAAQEGYLGGRPRLLPFPGSLVFWGVERARRAYQQLPQALQIPLLANVDRHESPIGIRVPQAGVVHQLHADQPTYATADGHLRNAYKRTHRWEKILRDQDQVELLGKEASLVNVLFGTLPDDVELYGKPMARNVQLWNERGDVLLDGPHASPAEIKRAMRTLQAGGVFGYRFLFPAMCVGQHEVYWHRPLVAYRDADGEVAVLPEAPLGYLTAYHADKPRLDRAIGLWPRLQRRPMLLAALADQDYTRTRQVPLQVRNVRKLAQAYALFRAKSLPVSFARRSMGLDTSSAWAMCCWRTTRRRLRQPKWPARPWWARCLSAGAPTWTTPGWEAGGRARKPRPSGICWW
jgi:hypothetical protein